MKKRNAPASREFAGIAAPANQTVPAAAKKKKRKSKFRRYAKIPQPNREAGLLET